MNRTLLRLLIVLTLVLATAGAGTYLYLGRTKPSRLASTISDNITHKPVAILNGPADLVTPLDGGYIFISKNTRGLSYTKSGTVTDISASFGLSSHPNSGAKEAYNAVVSIEPTTKGVVVTTVNDVYLVKSSSNIVRLQAYNKKLNLTASTFDAQTQSLFVLSAYAKSIFRYDLTRPAEKPSIFYTNDREMNRLAASGGKLAAYFDSVPSSEPQVLAEYERTRQLAPLIIDTSSGKVLKRLTSYKPITHLSISQNGNYLALKKKLAATITIYNLATDAATTIPSYDTGGGGWRGNVFYLARDHGIVSYDAGSNNSILTKVAATQTPITRLLVTANDMVFSMNNDTSGHLIPSNQAVPPSAAIIPPNSSDTLYQYGAQ